MSDTQVTDYVQKMKSLCAIIQERDAEILKKRLTIKAREKETAENKRKIKELKRHQIDWYKEEIKTIQAVCNKQSFIKSWLIQNREVHLEAMFNGNKLRCFVRKELIIEKEKSVALQAEFTAKAAEARAICLENVEYKEMENNRVAVLKAEITLKMKLVDVVNAKKRIALKNEIKRKQFYAVFIKLANQYVLEQKLREYKQMQENIQALEEKINNLRHKEKEFAKTMAFKRKLDQYDFGNQFTPPEKPSFTPDEFKENAVKIQILENKTIRAPLLPPKPEPPLFKSMPQTQLINRKSLLLRQWQKIVAKKSNKLNTSQSSQLSQQSQKDLNVSKEGNKLFQAPAEPQEELVEYELNDSLENQTASQPASTIPVYASSDKQSILQNFTKNNENHKQTKSTASNIFSKSSQEKKYCGETPKTVRFIMDQPFGQSMFDMSKGFDKGATFTLPGSTENISLSGGEVAAGCTSDMNFELSKYESGVTDVPEFSFAAPEFQQSSASIAPVPFSSSKGFFSLQNQMPFRF